MELDVSRDFARRLLRLIYQKFAVALEEAALKIAARGDRSRVRQSLLRLLEGGVDAGRRGYWQEGIGDHIHFSEFKIINDAAVEAYQKYCPVKRVAAEGTVTLCSFDELGEEELVFATDVVSRSPIFHLYTQTRKLSDWVVVEGVGEYCLFRDAVVGSDRVGFSSEREIYVERNTVLREVKDSAMSRWLRGDYAMIDDDIFNGVMFMVLPASLPKSWKRGDAAAATRASVAMLCPARVLVNAQHPLIVRLNEFAGERQPESAEGRELKLLLDSLADGVIETDKVTIGRGRWNSVRGDLSKLIGFDCSQFVYDALMIRK
jgi:hypothetical protein